MKRSIFLILSGLFFIFMAASLTEQLSGKGFQGNPIPTHHGISIIKPEAIILSSNPFIFIQFFNTFCCEIEEPFSASSLYSPPISINHGAAKIPSSKYLDSSSAINYLLTILPRRNSDTNPILV